MNPLAVYFLGIFTAIVAWWCGRMLLSQLRERRRARLYRRPFPDAWRELLIRNVQLYQRLPDDLRVALQQRVQYLIASKEFVGRGGLQITDEHKVTIAAQACLLVLSEQGEIFPGFRTIIVYPDTFFSDRDFEEDGVVTRERDHRAGESWHRGPIVLSWGDVLRGGLDDDDGFNVVIHEFAHKLDEQNVATNGQPLLRSNEHYGEWVRVLNREYEEFLRRVKRRSNTVLDSYGAESPPEFFAVASESFFEKPVEMRERLPELYQQLSRFYQLDPAGW